MNSGMVCEVSDKEESVLSRRRDFEHINFIYKKDEKENSRIIFFIRN
jgi:hypothetical protein